jgi:HD superfamily phosphohydrolase
MGILGNALSRLIDNGERQALSLLSEAQRAIDNFDFDATVDSIVEGSKSAFADFNDLVKTIKDTVSDLKVTIPFNSKKEKYEYSVKDGVLKVIVKGKGSVREASSTIPSNCIIDKLSVFVDKKNGNLVITIPKDVTKDETLLKAQKECMKKVNDVSTKAKETVGWLKDAIKERAEAVAASTEAPTSKPKANKKAAKHKPKVVRGADGKFKSTKKS